MALLRFKLGLGSQGIVLPEANSIAIGFLQERGFQETARAPRMVLGADVDWHPTQVFSRGSGYSG